MVSILGEAEIYAVKEGRNILGFGPVSVGESPVVSGAAGLTVVPDDHAGSLTPTTVVVAGAGANGG
jgi:hypothetical protein